MATDETPRCTVCGREHDELLRRCKDCRRKRKRYLTRTGERHRPRAAGERGQRHGLHNVATASEERIAYLAARAEAGLPLFGERRRDRDG